MASLLGSLGSIDETERMKLIEKALMNLRDIDIKTELTDIQVGGFAKAEFVGDLLKKTYGLKVGDMYLRFCRSYKAKLISLNRAGRKESVTVLRTINEEEQQTKGLFKRALGL